MTPDRWKRVREIFDSVLEHGAPDRAAYLEQACAGDALLRQEVEALMAADDRAGSFLERPLVAAIPGWPTGPRVLDETAGTRLPAGSHLGSYEVISFIGAGGMGCVYRARDVRLGREVALKVLGSSAGDGLARFQNEARAIAGLNHPGIVTVHDVGEDHGLPFFAMELVEGRSLRQLVAGGALPPRKALAIGAQVARALAAAHARGIVHRDLKPENVMVGRDGLVKVLDFGLAKLLLPESGEPHQDTIDLPTRPGTILGTAGYMAPEQASGRAADFRADHFAFGAMLYEMLTGRRAFEAPTAVETLTAIIRDEPAPLPRGADGPSLPVQWVLERCLAKEPSERYGSTEDLARDLERARDLLSSPELAMGAPPFRRRAPRAWLWAAAAMVAGLGGSVWLLPRLLPATPPEPPQFRHLTHSGSDFSLDVAPDGRLVAFSSHRDGSRRIWIKQIGSGAEAALTEGPADDNPRFSADGSSILFTRAEAGGTSLFHVPSLGGAPRRLLQDARSGEWSPDGKRLAFLRHARDSSTAAELLGIAGPRGEEPRIVDRFDAVIANPLRWSPDSRRLALTHAHGAALLWSVLVYDVDAQKRLVLSPPQPTGILSPAVWLQGGRALLYSQADSPEGSVSGRLVRQEIGSGRVRTLLHVPALGGALDVVGPGSVAFTIERVRGNLREVSLGAEPALPARWLTRGDSDDRQPSYSPDGQRIVFSSNRDGQLDVWEVSPPSGSLRRLTESVAEDWDPRLTAQGKLVWSSKRSGNFEVWMSEPDGSAPRQITRDSVDAENPAVTPDGQWIVYAAHDPRRRGLWKVRSDGSQRTLLAAGNLGLPEISPDGSLVLYGAFTPPSVSLRALRLADGAAVPFELRLTSARSRTETGFIRGRARWMPDGRRVAFVDVDAQGRVGVFVQDFVPGADTSASRRPLAGFESDTVTESFGLSPDGSRITLTLRERTSHLVLAREVAGVEP